MNYLNLESPKESDFENIQFEFRKRKSSFLEENPFSNTSIE